MVVLWSSEGILKFGLPDRKWWRVVSLTSLVALFWSFGPWELRGVVALDHHVDSDGRCICFGGKPLILVFRIKQWRCLEPLTLMRATFLEQVLAKGVWREGRCLRR